MSTTRKVVELTGGPEVEVEHIDVVDEDTGRFEVDAVDDGRRWHVDISRDGDCEVVRAWDGNIIVDGDEPDWLFELASLALAS
ncbi:hypothetical protein [Haloarcula sp. JP-L23]|uniref:hypothetical protein n=1 Tax=Haloarcula sp. JP-L23 TaxID=2716717 RepID=UPI00140F169B|nr:hypothetical protein G9465_24295 [Haloarcula sp. JP-L23]